MKPSSVSLVGSRLCFDPSGGAVFAIEADAIAIADLLAGKTHRLPYAHARAITALADQLWIATSDECLVRTDFAGRALGDPAALPFAATGLFVPAPCGAPAAAWSSTPAVVLFDDLGALRCLDGSDADATFPLTARRHLTARGARLTLPSGSTVALPPGTTAIGGVVMADGKHVTVLVAGASVRQLLSISIGTGQVVQRCAVGAGIVRVAVRRGAAVTQTTPRAFELIDLRSGRVTATIELAHDVSDLAIDPDAQRCVMRLAAGTIEVCELAELVRARTVVTPATESIASEQPSATVDVAGEWTEVTPQAAPPIEPVVETVPAAVPAIDEVAELVVPPLRALSPRGVRPTIDRNVAHAHLERELRSVSLWLLAAIARGWDSRRIGYGNEGKHPFELEVAAILGLEGGHAASYVVAARERLDAHELELAADPAWRGLDTPLGRLADELGLSSRALDILMVVAAPALHGELARLIGILANDPARALDELAVQQILGARHDRDELAAELDANAPLVRLGLVQLAPQRRRPFAELSIDPAIVDRLRGRPAHLGTATVRRASDRALAELDIPRAALCEALAALARPPHDPVRISIYGRTGNGRTTFLAAACAAAGRELAVIDALALPRAADAFVVELERALRRVQLVGLVPCIVHLDEVTFDDRAARDVASEVFRLHPGPVAAILGTGAPSPFAAGHLAITLPALAETDRRHAWLHALAEANVVLDDVDALAARYRIGPGLIRRAITAAHDAPEPATAPATLPGSVVEAFIRQTRDARLGQFATRVERLASWSNIVLPPDILDSLRELVGRVRHGRLVYDTWGMSRTMHSSRGLTAMFQGRPGTGKTLVAGVIARELGLDLYQVDLSKVMSKWIGETERNLATIFDAAEDGQAVLLFDEADSLFAKRTEVRSSNDRYANLEVNYLLQRIDSFEGIAILTTNHGTSIDQALKRRLSFRLSFPFPDEETREQLWRTHLPPELPTSGPLTFDTLARKYQISGGYIRNACLRAAFLAAQEDSPLHQHHLERAVALEFAELGKLSNTGAVD